MQDIEITKQLAARRARQVAEAIGAAKGPVSFAEATHALVDSDKSEFNVRCRVLEEREGLTLSEASKRVIREYPALARRLGLSLTKDGTVKLADGGAS